MAYIGTSPSNGVRRKHTYTATASQTSFSGAGAEGATLSYTDSNFVDVYQNGVKLSEADYTSTTGTTVVLATGATVSDMIEIIVYDVFSVADTVSKADGGTFDNAVTINGDVAITGTTPKLTIGDGGAEDTAIVFDGNAQDFYIGLDDTNDNLSIGLGSTVGSTQLIKMTSGDIVVNEDSADINFRVEGNADATLFKVDAGEDNVKIKTDNNYAALVIENDDAGSQERALYASVTATSGTSANNVALFSATHSNMTNPLVRIHHEDPSADQLLIQATTTGSNTVKFSVDEDGDIYSTGNLVIGTSGKGIDFSATSDATGMTNELLDDYEIGTYTASVTGSTSGSYTVGDSATKLSYTKIGRMVHLQGQIHITGKSSPSGVVNVSLPFASGNTTDLAERSVGSVAFDSNNSSIGVSHNSGNFVNFMVSSNSSVGIFRSSEEGTGAGSLNQSHLDTGDRFTIGITYMTFA